MQTIREKVADFCVFMNAANAAMVGLVSTASILEELLQHCCSFCRLSKDIHNPQLSSLRQTLFTEGH